jgi:hypothetical protein
MLDRLARTLERGPHAIEFHGWSRMLLWFGAVVFVGHLLTFVMVETGVPKPLHWAARLGQFAILGILFWYYRGARTVLATSAAERQLWSIWLGYLAAFAVSALVSRQLWHMIRPDAPWEELTLYPFSSLLTGLAFFAMGSNYWGKCYAFGLAFMGLAVLMLLKLDLAPLLFGLLWSITFVTLGLHLRRLGRENGPEPGDEHVRPTITGEYQP